MAEPDARANLPWYKRLGLRVATPRFVRKFLGPKVFAKADRWMLERTKGRLTVFGPPIFPTLVLTTTGRRSGEPRKVSLVYAPLDGAIHVVASNWAREHHPAWSENLLANPGADVISKEGSFPVRAHLLDAEEKKEAWPDLVELMPQWDFYTTITDRDLRVFRLDRASEGADAT